MSRAVADWIGDDPAGGDSLGFVFPVYGWRLPKVLRRRIRQGFGGMKPSFIWAVATCGDNVGDVDRDLDDELRPVVGRGLDAAYSVAMPDTYLGLPGFRLDSKEEAEAKMRSARGRCAGIAAALRERRRVRDLERGAFAWFKTSVAGRFFERYLATDRLFKVDAARCTGCGRCAAECPTGSVVAGKGGVPAWKRDGGCTGCFHCYHACLAGAIEFGPFTRGKGRLGAGCGPVRCVSTCIFHAGSV